MCIWRLNLFYLPWQPLRSHHCRYCGHCVAKYDHHCFILGTCIGEKNHARFWWFLFFQSIEAASAIAIVSGLAVLLLHGCHNHSSDAVAVSLSLDHGNQYGQVHSSFQSGQQDQSWIHINAASFLVATALWVRTSSAHFVRKAHTHSC